MQISVPSNSLCVSICCRLSAFSLLMIHTAYLKPWVMNSSILRTDISTVGDLSVPWVPIVVVTVFVLSPVGIALPRISTNLSQFSPSQLYRILTVLSFTSHLSVLFPFSVLVISSFHLLQVSMSSSECDVPHPLALLAPLPPLCMTWASTLSYCPGYGQQCRGCTQVLLDSMAPCCQATSSRSGKSPTLIQASYSGLGLHKLLVKNW